MSDLLSIDQALARLLEKFSPLDVMSIPLSEAGGRVAAQELRAAVDLPRFSNSAMDGFAVRSQDVACAALQNPCQLQVVADIPAGASADVLITEGQAARIMTGAPIPDGADAVVPVEHTDFNYRQPGLAAPQFVRVFHPPRQGGNIRWQGEDIRAGDLVFQAGRKLRPQDLGLLSMLGLAELAVYRNPRLAILSSGDELQPAGAPLAPGKIYDSNSLMLAALARQEGAEILSLGIVPDQLNAVHAALQSAVEAGVDIILSSAGVSVGAFDFLRAAVEEKGSLDFWKVNMRPGKPLAFGSYCNIPYIGLPGNPVSAFIGFEVFARPALRKMAGLAPCSRRRVPALIDEDVDSDGRQNYLRGVAYRSGEILRVRLTGHQGSGNLHSLVEANALVIIPAGVRRTPAGSQVDLWLFDDDCA